MREDNDMENFLQASLSFLGTLCVAGIVTYFSARLQKRKFFSARSIVSQLLFGLIFGLLSVYATNTAVLYNTALISVRDAGPLVAGIAFGPFAGILAGLIGGLERLLMHTGVTTIPCSISVVVAGLAGAGIGCIARKNAKLPNPLWGLVIGGGMEVFHLLLALFISKGTLAQNWNIVTVAGPIMTLFGALTVMLSLYIYRDIAGDKLK